MEKTEKISDLDKFLREKIGFTPHNDQKEILKSDSRDIVICAGRRFGKSILCAYVVIKTLARADLEGKPVKIWIVSPTYELSKKVFEYLVKWFIQCFPSQRKGVNYRPFPQIRTARGSLVQCRSTENPAGLLGEELDLLIVDECSRIKKDIYETYLYPTTTSRQGRTFFISTPFGKNWFYDQWVRAKEHNGAFQFNSMSGLIATLGDERAEYEWNRAKRILPADVFEQEFMAVFREGAASVFRGVREIINPDCLEGVQVGHRYVMGLDLAKFRDFTVMIVIDKLTHRVVFLDRFHKIPYTLQKERIINTAMGYNNAKIVIDSLNVGASLGDDLRAHGMNVKDFKTTGSTWKTSPSGWTKKGSKERLIERLSSFIQEHNLEIPPDARLIDELEAYGYEMTDAGNLKYGAPSGLHDDHVISLALAVWVLPMKTKKQAIKAKRSLPRQGKSFQYL